ncbi:biopolymer transporter ExbD [bacterium]|nr:biopolymer transporter ExbD [bacterium]MCI0604021.1 biopolymer transporter ExbD [bacterium]
MQLTAEEIKSDINVTPLVDVVLVLLIIFMVVTPMIVSRNVEVPVTQNPGNPQKGMQKIIYLTETGDLFFEEVPVVGEVLLNRLQELQQREPGARILLQADRRLSYDTVMMALELISRSGFLEVGLIAKPVKN